VTSIRLTADERNTLLHHLRRDPDPQVRLRAHILLLLALGYSWATVTTVLFTSPDTIARWSRRFRRGGVDEVLGRPRGRARSAAWAWVAVVLREDHATPVSRETVRRWLREAGLVWRQPRLVLRPKDSEREAKLAALRRLLGGLPADETAVFMDEVDVNLNPETGRMWMRRGQQAPVETPGTNEKRYLAGSIHWRTGRVFLIEGLPKEGRSAALLGCWRRATASASRRRRSSSSGPAWLSRIIFSATIRSSFACRAL
jgi:transposase